MDDPAEGPHPIEWAEGGRTEGDPPIRTIQFKVSLEKLTSHLQNALQLELDVARLCLAGIEKAEGPTLDVPASFFHLDPAQNRKLPLASLKEQARWWILRNAFKNSVDALAPLLEHTRDVLALWSLPKIIKGEDYNRAMTFDRDIFHKKGPKDKIEFLEKTFGFSVPDDWTSMLYTITQARNCLVHRAGRVGPQDCRGEPDLVVRWMRLGTFADRGRGLEPAGPGSVIRGGEHLVVSRHPAEKRFALGDIVHFTLGELNELCYTLLQFGERLKPVLEARRKNLANESQPVG